MSIEIEKAIDLLTGQITPNMKSDDALRLTQAALNLAHTAAVLKQLEK